MFARLGTIVLRLRYVVVLAWLVAAVAAYRLAPSLSVVGSADETSFLPANAESMHARDLLARAFPADASSGTATLVFSRASGLTGADHAYIAGLDAWVRSGDAPPGIRDAISRIAGATTDPQLASLYRSADGVVELAMVQMTVVPFQTKSNTAIDELRAHLASTRPAGLVANVTGQAGVGRDYMQSITDGTDRTTLVTVVLVILILLAIYRAPLAALVPLLTIAAAFLVSRGILGELAQAGWKVSSILDSFIVVLVFGVGTDYTIFLVSRFREEVGGNGRQAALERTVGRMGAVITASAATVVVGLGSMIVGSFGMIQTTGPALAIAIVVTLVAGLTLTPALLAIFGRALFWPLHERTAASAAGDRGVWIRIASFLTRRPGLVLTAVLVVLLIPLAAVPSLRSNFDELNELPATADSRLGFEQLGAHLDKGQLLPTTVLVDIPGSTRLIPAILAGLKMTTDRLAATAGVQQVRSIVEPTGDRTTPDALRPSATLTSMATALTPSSNPAAALAALARPDALTGLQSAVAYLSALKPAFPGAAAGSAYTSAAADLASLENEIRRLRASARVSVVLATLAQPPATSPITDADPTARLTAIGGYLTELVAAYPEVASMPALASARQTLSELPAARDAATQAALASKLSLSLGTIGAAFADRQDAILFSRSLPQTPAGAALQTSIANFSAAVPGELRALAAVFKGRPDDLFLPVGLGGTASTQASALVSTYLSGSGDVSRLFVTVKGDPYATGAFDTVRSMRAALEPTQAAFGRQAVAYVGGATAQFADIQTTIAQDFQRVALITIAGILVVLVLLLRSVVAPIYLVLTVLLSYGATLGLSGLIFQGALGQPGLNYFIPLIVFVLLVALGSDYNIFLMARVREECEDRELRDGIRRASARTGTVITSAGIILAGTFAALTTAPLQMLVQVGATVALGVLLDTFLVRSLLVPSLTALVGEAAWWPARRRQPRPPG